MKGIRFEKAVLSDFYLAVRLLFLKVKYFCAFCVLTECIQMKTFEGIFSDESFCSLQV